MSAGCACNSNDAAIRNRHVDAGPGGQSYRMNTSGSSAFAGTQTAGIQSFRTRGGSKDGVNLREQILADMIEIIEMMVMTEQDIVDGAQLIGRDCGVLHFAQGITSRADSLVCCRMPDR